jgi:hypothetical protein
MLNYKIVILPNNLPLKEQISEVSRQISEWLRSLDVPSGFKVVDANLRLINITKTDEEYAYQYSITLGNSTSRLK